MQVVYAFAVAAALVVLLSVPETGATKHLMLAPFLWAGHLVKDAAHHLAAFKLSIATKLLAMITGNRSFRATLEYDSRIERYRPSVESSGGYQNKVPDFHPHPARPSPVHLEKNVKVDWFPGVKFPHFSLPSLPKLSLPQLPKMSHLNPFKHLSKFHLPSIPHLFHLHHKSLPQLPSIAGAVAAPKFASGFFSGGFKVGSGNAVQLSPGPVAPAVVVCCPAPVGGVGRSLALANSEQFGKSQTLARANDTAVPVATTPHELYKPRVANSTVDDTTPWLSVRDGSQTFSDSNGTAVPVVTSLDGFHKQKEANSAVDITTPWLPINNGSQTFPDSKVTEVPVVTSLDGFQKQKEANTTVGDTTSPATVLNRTRRVVDSATDGYFSFIRAIDERRCIAKMVCSMAAAPQEFGAYGERVLAFFEGMDSPPGASTLVYRKAVTVGKSGRDCTAFYPECKVDPKYLAGLGSTEL